MSCDDDQSIFKRISGKNIISSSSLITELFNLTSAFIVFVSPVRTSLSALFPLILFTYFSNFFHVIIQITHMEMIKGIQGHGYYDELVVPIIENTAHERELTDSLAEAVCSLYFFIFFNPHFLVFSCIAVAPSLLTHGCIHVHTVLQKDFFFFKQKGVAFYDGT